MAVAAERQWRLSEGPSPEALLLAVWKVEDRRSGRLKIPRLIKYSMVGGFDDGGVDIEITDVTVRRREAEEDSVKVMLASAL